MKIYNCQYRGDRQTGGKTAIYVCPYCNKENEFPLAGGVDRTCEHYIAYDGSFVTFDEEGITNE